MKSSTFNYEETPLVELLVLSSFLYFVNILGWITEQLLHAGLIAQIAVGIIYGPPLANIISQNWLAALQALGNLGLILLIFQGLCKITKSKLEILIVYFPRRVIHKIRPLKSKRCPVH